MPSQQQAIALGRHHPSRTCKLLVPHKYTFNTQSFEVNLLILNSDKSLKMYKVAYNLCPFSKVLAIVVMKYCLHLVFPFLVATQVQVKQQALLLSSVGFSPPTELPSQVPGRNPTSWLIVLLLTYLYLSISKSQPLPISFYSTHFYSTHILS